MYKIFLSVFFVSIVLVGCAFNKYSQPSNLMFQHKSQTMSQSLVVTRDGVLCKNETESEQSCPVDLYIDNFKVGSFFANNNAQFFIQNQLHNIKLKNCTTDSCKSCELDLNSSDLQSKELIISLDENERPYFKGDNEKLKCS